MFSLSTHKQTSDRFLNKIPQFNKKKAIQKHIFANSYFNLPNTYISIAIYAQTQPCNSTPVFPRTSPCNSSSCSKWCFYPNHPSLMSFALVHKNVHLSIYLSKRITDITSETHPNHTTLLPLLLKIAKTPYRITQSGYWLAEAEETCPCSPAMNLP